MNRLLISLLLLATFTIISFGLTQEASAVAPARAGQPYAENICTTDPNIIFCEDFDYEQNFGCVQRSGQSSYNSTWINPGASQGNLNFVYCYAADFPLASGLPAGAGVTGRVFRSRPALDPGGSAYEMCILGDCDRATHDTPGTYMNGSPATNDLYMRFQMYTSANHPFPTGRDNKVIFWYPNQFTGKTEANVDAGFSFNVDIFCAPNNYNDAVNIRVGSNSGSFKKFPADANIAPYNSHFEYCSGTGAPNGQFGDTTVPVDTNDPPSVCTPNPGTLFRMCRGRWYTVEIRYKLSSPGVQNGTIETWIDGVKIYSASDLETCGGYGSSQGSCYALHQIQLLNSWAYYPSAEYTALENCGNCYRLIDNFIISKSYIGPPGGAGSDTTPPAAPSNLRIF